jgi:hypothetical protein
MAFPDSLVGSVVCGGEWATLQRLGYVAEERAAQSDQDDAAPRQIHRVTPHPGDGQVDANGRVTLT